MTSEEIVKRLKENMGYGVGYICAESLIKETVSIIESQQAEIERLQKIVDGLPGETNI